MKTLIVIPAYNESLNIKETVSELKNYLNENIDYIVVNDGSTDNTEEVLKKNNIKYINNPKNLGLKRTMQEGFKYSITHNFDYVIQLDGDGQHDPKFIKNAIEKADRGFDLVLGNRFYSQKRRIKGRHLGNLLLSWCIKLVTFKTVKDTTCGFRLYDKSLVKMFANQKFFDVEPSTIAYLVLCNVKVADIPIIIRTRKFGKSHFNLWNIFKYMTKHIFKTLFVVRFKKKIAIND